MYSKHSLMTGYYKLCIMKITTIYCFHLVADFYYIFRTINSTRIYENYVIELIKNKILHIMAFNFNSLIREIKHTSTLLISSN